MEIEATLEDIKKKKKSKFGRQPTTSFLDRFGRQPFKWTTVIKERYFSTHSLGSWLLHMQLQWQGHCDPQIIRNQKGNASCFGIRPLAEANRSYFTWIYMKSLHEKDLNPLEWKRVLHHRHNGWTRGALSIKCHCSHFTKKQTKKIFLYPSNHPSDLENLWVLNHPSWVGTLTTGSTCLFLPISHSASDFKLWKISKLFCNLRRRQTTVILPIIAEMKVQLSLWACLCQLG